MTTARKPEGALFGIDAPDHDLWKGDPLPADGTPTPEQWREAIELWERNEARGDIPQTLFFSPAEYRRLRADCEALGIAHHFKWDEP